MYELRRFLLGIFMVLVLIEIWVFLNISKFSSRLIRVKSLNNIKPKQLRPLDYFKGRVSGEPWAKAGDVKTRYIGALEWVMNRSGAVGPEETDDPVELLKSVEVGGCSNCTGMAILYQNTLAAVGLPSRTVRLQRNIRDFYDAHVTVEVLIDGKWVIMDPSFNVTFENPEGELLSAQEIKTLFFKGLHDRVKPVFHGEVKYPARLEKYYIDYLPLFNNIFVLDNQKSNSLSKIPPFRYWFGPRAYYEKIPNESVQHLDFTQKMMYFLIGLIPLAIIFIVILLIMFTIPHVISQD